MITYLSEYEWLYQYSIFVDVNDYEIAEARLHAMNWLDSFDDSRFKTYLRKRYKDVGMMYIIRKNIHRYHPSNKQFQQYYITIFTTQAIDGWKATKYSDFELNLVKRKVTLYKIQSTCSALKKQELHDLSSLGAKKRYTILNKAKVIPMGDSS